MRLTWRDGVATLAVALATAGYLLWVTDTAFTSTSTRVVALVVLALGAVGCTATGDRMEAMYGASDHDRAPRWFLVAATTAGVLALGSGLVAIIAASESMLAILVAAMVALWVLATVRHLSSGLAHPVHRLGTHH
jgi:hypothetical protein